MELNKALKDEIWDYCRINNISNIDEFTLKLVKQGFTIEKFGATPSTKVVEKVVEKIVEVPVEKIVEKMIEKIVEVPINMIDTEMTDKMKEQNELIEKLQKDLTSSIDLSNVLKKQLEDEKKKNNKDIYGEN